MSPATAPIGTAITLQLNAIAQRWPTPQARRLHVPHPDAAPGEHDAAFCAMELDDGACGLSHVLLGGNLKRALALAAINAMTDSVWRRSVVEVDEAMVARQRERFPGGLRHGHGDWCVVERRHTQARDLARGWAGLARPRRALTVAQGPAVGRRASNQSSVAFC